MIMCSWAEEKSEDELIWTKVCLRYGGAQELMNYESLQMNQDRILINKDKLWKNCKPLVVGIFNPWMVLFFYGGPEQEDERHAVSYTDYI